MQLSLTGTILAMAIESVVLVGVGAALNLIGVREFPSWINEDMLLITVVLYVTAHAVGMTLAVIGKPMASPRLPNLATTVKAWLFPAPPAHRYNARTKRGQP